MSKAKKSRQKTSTESEVDQSVRGDNLLLLPAVTSSAIAALNHLKKQHQHRRSIVAAVFLGLTLSLASLGVYRQISDKGSLGRLYVAGIEIITTQDSHDLEERLEQKAKNYKVIISKPTNDTKQQYSLEDVGITVDIPGTIRQAKATKQQGSLWQRMQWWQKQDVSVLTRIDRQKLHNFIENEATVVSKQPVNATLVIENGNSRLTSEHDGQGSFDPLARIRIVESASSLAPIELNLEKQVLKPKVTKQAVAAIKTQVDAILAQKVTIKIEKRTFSPDRLELAGWIDLPDFNADKGVGIEVNSGKISSYLDQIAKPYIQPPRNEVVMKGVGGAHVVLINGRNGTDISGKEKVATELAEAVLSGNGFSKDLSVDYAAYKTIDAESYDKWLVVDLANKRMDAYEQTNLVRSIKISAGAPATPTVVGQYKIYAKVKRQDMRGLNTDGSTYFQPNVEWTNYFYGDYAIHGNYWRPDSWFGNVNSSHGCIGITNVDGEWLYGWAPVGTPVITHL